MVVYRLAFEITIPSRFCILSMHSRQSVECSKEDLLAYAAFCREESGMKTAVLDYTSPNSGFYWLPFGKRELQFYNIRHSQRRTGDLSDRST